MAARLSSKLPHERASKAPNRPSNGLLPIRAFRSRRDAPQSPSPNRLSKTARGRRGPVALASLNPVRTPRWSRWNWVVMAAAILTLIQAARWMGDPLWRRHYAGQIMASWDTASGETLETSMLRLRLLGEPGWERLVQGLAHARPEVQQAARQHLTLELDSWRELESAESSQRVDQMSRWLQAALPELSLSGRRFAGNLATEMLVWPLDEEQVDPVQVVMRCEAILRSRLESGVLPQEPMPEPPSEPNPPSDSTSLPGVTEEEDWMTEGWEAAMLAESEVPASPLPLIDPLSPAMPLPPETGDPGLSSQGPSEASPIETEVEGDAGASSPMIVIPANPMSEPARRESIGAASPEVRETHWELLQRLHATDQLDRERAEEELKRRGFTPMLLEVGRELSAPQPERRRAMVALLRERRQFDPVPWLKQAAKDEDSEVRRAALLALIERGDRFEAETAQRRLDQLPPSPEILR